jgi:hypothetical protein
MGMTVWVDSWQPQCCGEPFHLGSHVAWTLGDADADWLRAMLGAGAQHTADAAEEHHGGVLEGTAPPESRVTSIAAVHCRYAPRPGTDPRARYPVPARALVGAIAPVMAATTAAIAAAASTLRARRCRFMVSLAFRDSV